MFEAMKKIPMSVILWGILSVALMMHLSLISFSNLWSDEICSMLLVRKSFQEMMAIIMNEDVHPPLYYILLKGWQGIFGISIIAARCLSLTALVCSGLLAIYPVRRLFGSSVAIWFLLLSMFMPVAFWVGLDIRMYSWAYFFLTAAVIYAAELLKTPSKSAWIKMTGFSLCGMYTHYYVIIALAGVYAALFLFLLFKRNKKEMLSFFVSGFFLALAYIPWLFVLYQQAGRVQVDFLLIWILFIRRLNCFFSSFSLIEFISIFSFLAAVSWILIFLYVLDYKKRDMHYGQVLLLVVPLLSALLIGFGLSVFVRPLLMWRYLLPAAGSFYLAIAIALVREKRMAVIFFIPFICAIYISYIVFLDRSNPTHIDVYLKSKFEKTDVILAGSLQTYMYLLYYLPEYDFYLDEKAFAGETSFLKNNLRILKESDIKGSYYMLDKEACAPNMNLLKINMLWKHTFYARKKRGFQ